MFGYRLESESVVGGFSLGLATGRLIGDGRGFLFLLLLTRAFFLSLPGGDPFPLAPDLQHLLCAGFRAYAVPVVVVFIAIA